MALQGRVIAEAMPGAVNDFVSRYRKEMDFYAESSRLVARQLEDALRTGGIRAIVTNRAKSLVRVEEKCRK